MGLVTSRFGGLQLAALQLSAVEVGFVFWVNEHRPLLVVGSLVG
jgi:hypothetical protein